MRLAAVASQPNGRSGRACHRRQLRLGQQHTAQQHKACDVEGQVKIGQAEKSATRREAQQADLAHPHQQRQPGREVGHRHGALRGARGLPPDRAPKGEVQPQAHEAVLAEHLEIDAVGDQNLASHKFRIRALWRVSSKDSAVVGPKAGPHQRPVQCRIGQGAPSVDSGHGRGVLLVRLDRVHTFIPGGRHERYRCSDQREQAQGHPHGICTLDAKEQAHHEYGQQAAARLRTEDRKNAQHDGCRQAVPGPFVVDRLPHPIEERHDHDQAHRQFVVAAQQAAAGPPDSAAAAALQREDSPLDAEVRQRQGHHVHEDAQLSAGAHQHEAGKEHELNLRHEDPTLKRPTLWRQ